MRIGLVVENDMPFVFEEVAALRRLGVGVDVASAFRPLPAARWRRHYASEVLYPERGIGPWARSALGRGLPRPSRLGAVLASARREAAPLRLVALAAGLARRARSAGWCHVHGSFASYPAWLAWATAELAGLPFSFTGHAYDIQRPRPWLTRLLGEAAFVRAISSESALRLRRLDSRWGHRVRVGHLGVDTQQFVPPVSRLPGPRVILAVSRLVPKKGLLSLVDAVAGTLRAGRPARLRIVGDGPELPALRRRIAQQAVGPWVTLAGAADRRGVLAALQTASVFALPCQWDAGVEHDGLPVAILEAMATELPVVSTALGGIGDAILDERNGLLVPPGDAPALGRALIRLLDDEALRRRLGRAARATVLERFALEDSAGRLADWMRASMRVSRPGRLADALPGALS